MAGPLVSRPASLFVQDDEFGGREQAFAVTSGGADFVEQRRGLRAVDGDAGCGEGVDNRGRARMLADDERGRSASHLFGEEGLAGVATVELAAAVNFQLMLEDSTAGDGAVGGDNANGGAGDEHAEAGKTAGVDAAIDAG